MTWAQEYWRLTKREWECPECDKVAEPFEDTNMCESCWYDDALTIVHLYQIDSPHGMLWEYIDPEHGPKVGENLSVEILDIMARGYQVEIHPWFEEVR